MADPRDGRRSRRHPLTPMSTLARLAATSPDITAIPVSTVMSREVLVVDPRDPVVEVWQRMQDVSTELAVVREATRVVAVVS